MDAGWSWRALGYFQTTHRLALHGKCRSLIRSPVAEGGVPCWSGVEGSGKSESSLIKFRLWLLVMFLKRPVVIWSLRAQVSGMARSHSTTLCWVDASLPPHMSISLGYVIYFTCWWDVWQDDMIGQHRSLILPRRQRRFRCCYPKQVCPAKLLCFRATVELSPRS
jgi:hypothetical protein